MEKQYKITLLLILLASVLHAQVPGYMGKRASIHIDANPSPALLNMNINHNVAFDIADGARAKQANIFSFNIRPQLSFEYLLGKKVALGLNYHHIITGTVKEVNEDQSVISYDIMKGDAVGMDIKFYRQRKSQSIAPIGYYNKFGVALSRLNTYNTRDDSRKQFRKDLYYPIVSWSFGKQFMPFSNFLIGTGAELSLPLVSFEEGNSGSFDTVQSVKHMRNSLIGYYFFNLKLSVGYMLF